MYAAVCLSLTLRTPALCELIPAADLAQHVLDQLCKAARSAATNLEVSDCWQNGMPCYLACICPKCAVMAPDSSLL